MLNFLTVYDIEKKKNLPSKAFKREYNPLIHNARYNYEYVE